MSEEYRGYYTSCPIHSEENDENGLEYKIEWRGKGKEVIGHYFPCCGSVCLKSTYQQFKAVQEWLKGQKERQPKRVSLWVKEALEGDSDIWRDRGELDAIYGFGEVADGETPHYKVHEAITYFHTLDESIGETSLFQLFLSEPHMLSWEMDEVMASPEMHDDIRKHYDVNLFQELTKKATEETLIENAIAWLKGHALLTPDPFGAVQSMYRLMAKNNTLPKSIKLSDINTLIEHSEHAGFDFEEHTTSMWLNDWFQELKDYGIELDDKDKHPDFVP